MTKENLTYNQNHKNNIREIIARETGVAVVSKQKRNGVKRWAIAFAAFAGCFLVATPALAASVPEAYYVLYMISPATAQFFRPVQKSVVDQGIEVGVESAYIHGSTAEAMITVRDLEGDRLDDSLDLYDSYDIRIGFDCTGHCEQMGYDAATKTATILISISSMDEKNIIQGNKLTFSLSTLLTGREETIDVAIPMDWNAIPKTVETELADPYDGNVLVPGESQREFEDGFYLSGIGYVDGKLHIQLYTPGRDLRDDHAFLHLRNAAGDQIEAQMLYRGGYRGMDPAEDERANYVEYAFDVPQSELDQWSLYGDFYHATGRIDGNWSITFPLELGE